LLVWVNSAALMPLMEMPESAMGDWLVFDNVID
jgi:hypothetical protein